MKIIIFLALIDSLRAFADQMARGFQEKGCQVLLADMEDEAVTRKQVLAFAGGREVRVLFFNHVGLNLLDEAGQSIWNLIHADCYDYIVDHPMYYHAALCFPIERLTMVCVDRNHTQYIRRFYGDRPAAVFLPLGGTGTGQTPLPFQERPIDIIFTGPYVPDRTVENAVRGMDPEAAMLWRECYQWLWANKDQTLERAVEQCFQLRGLQPQTEELGNIIRMFRDIDGVLRNQTRAEVIRALTGQGLKVHVYGGGWEALDCRQENLVPHGRVTFEESIELMAQAKVVLNVMPWFKAGAHDRIYSAMLGQSAAFTDRSQYLDQTLTDGENVIFYSLDDLEGAAVRLIDLLRHPENLEAIAGKGYEYAKDTQTWEHRAAELLQIWSEN